jgi:pleiotropic regulator 1
VRYDDDDDVRVIVCRDRDVDCSSGGGMGGGGGDRCGAFMLRRGVAKKVEENRRKSKKTRKFSMAALLPAAAVQANAQLAQQRWGDQMSAVAPRTTQEDAISYKTSSEYSHLPSPKKHHQVDSALTLSSTTSTSRPPTRRDEHLPLALQVRREQPQQIPSKPHANWKLFRVLPEHEGVPNCVAVDPSNLVFATGDADRKIIIWDLATGQIKQKLADLHTHAVRGLVFSSRHAYMFSCGEDKRVRCFDLEYNKVVREYYGHLAAVYSLALHPTLDLLISGSRDSSARVWDIRTRAEVHILGGHKDTVSTIGTQAVDPQVVTGSEDQTVKLWDLMAGRCMQTLTHHRRGVRALVLHPSTEFTFAAASTGSIKKFAFPEGRFVHDFEGMGKGIVNTMALNRDGVLVAGGEDGLGFFDWGSAKQFQSLAIPLLPGSLKTEATCLAASFDMTGSRLITCNADKSVHMHKEVQ